MIVRNDDVGFDTTLHEIRTFCEICDRYGVTPLHAITPIGNVQAVQASMDNATIRRVSGTALFSENREVVEYLSRRNDKIAVHGLWHTHDLTHNEIGAGAELICELPIGYPAFYVPPFNECTLDAEYLRTLYGLEILGAGIPRLEDFLDSGVPAGEIAYLHSWRFEKGYGGFSWERLDKCLARITKQ